MLTLGLLQMAVGKDKMENLAHARSMVQTAVSQGAQIVILPEMFLCPYDTACFPSYAETQGGFAWRFLSQTARDLSTVLVAGSLPELEQGRLYNTCYVFGPDGSLLARHRKAHLFDIDVPGGQSFRESDVLSPGAGITVLNTPFARIGLGICFDMRFAMDAQAMVRQGAELLIYPAAFNPTTGPAHWELLLRSRALDGQCFAVGVASARNLQATYHSYGHSMVADPWGSILYEAGYDETLGLVTIDTSRIHEVRQAIPLTDCHKNQ